MLATSDLEGSEALLVSVDRAAQLLGISRTEVYRAVARRELPACRVGRRRLISRRALETFIARLEAESAAEVGE